MVNYSIAEEFVLPSKGKVYSQEVNPVVKLRSMTTQEEMKRLAPSERAYKNICEIIDDCMIDNPGISAYDMCLSDYQFLLHKLRIVTYGSEYHLSTKCPHCRSEQDSVVNLNDLETVEFDAENLTKIMEFTLPKTGKKIKIRLQTPRMIDDVATRSKEVKKKSRGQDGESAFLYNVASLIETIDGKRIDPVKKEDFVRNLPMMDTNYIVKHSQKLVESFGLDTSLDMFCPTCGLDYTTFFRVTAEFFGPSVDF